MAKTAKKPATPSQYLDSLGPDRQPIISAMHKAIMKGLPKGFVSCINYGMIGYVVPHSLYPAGYHCDPKLPLPLMGLASGKAYISLHHMGLYCDPAAMKWFTTAWAAQCDHKLEMGKGCIRFKKPEQVPLKLIENLAGKMTVASWIEIYERLLARPRTKGRSSQP